MEHADNQINLSPILYLMSLFLSFATLSKPMWLTLYLSSSRWKGKPLEVVCLNATEGFG